MFMNRNCNHLKITYTYQLSYQIVSCNFYPLYHNSIIDMVLIIDGTIFEIKLNTQLICLTFTYSVILIKFSEYKYHS